DKNGEEKITICDGSGKRVLTFDVKAKKLLIEAKEGSIELHAQKKIVLRCEDLEVKTSKSAKLKTGSSFDLKIDTDGAMKSGSTFTLKGSKLLLNPSNLTVAVLAATQAIGHGVTGGGTGGRSAAQAGAAPAPSAARAARPPPGA